MLGENHVFAVESRKQGGLTALLNRQKARRSSTSAEPRSPKPPGSSTHFLVHEFAEWSGALISSVEQGVTAQLTAALMAKGAPGIDGLRKSVEDLERLQHILETNGTAIRLGPEEIVQDWFGHVALRSASR